MNLTVIDVVEVLGNAIKKIIGDDNQGMIKGLNCEGFTAVLESELVGVVDVEASCIENTLLEEGLELGMAVPGVEVGLGEVGEDIAEIGDGELVLLTKLGEVGKEMEGEATRTSAEFAKVEGLGTGEMLVLILPAGEDNFCVGDRNGGITGNIVDISGI